MVNHIYLELDDTKWVYEQLKTKSMSKLSKELGCFRGSIDWIVRTKFCDEWQKELKYDRVPHKNKKKVKLI